MRVAALPWLGFCRRAATRGAPKELAMADRGPVPAGPCGGEYRSRSAEGRGVNACAVEWSPALGRTTRIRLPRQRRHGTTRCD
jgi:hypothetical protein